MKEQIKQALTEIQGEEDCAVDFEQHRYIESYVTVSGCVNKKYSHLIANAPEWLKWQNERIEQLETEVKDERHTVQIQAEEIRGLKAENRICGAQRERIEQLENHIEWANRIIGSGLDVGAQLRYDPMKWLIEYHENFRKEE